MDQSSDRRNLVAACASISVFGFAFGMIYPLLSLILEARGTSPDLIGTNAAMSPIGILLASGMIPIAAKRFGSRRTAMAAALMTACLMLSYRAFDNLATWFVLRLLQGMSVSTLFVLSEAWIVQFASGSQRGRIVAVYAAVLSASFGAGPLLISFIGIEGWKPFLIGSGVVLAGMVPLALIRERPPVTDAESTSHSLVNFAPKAPVLLAAVLCFAIFDAATLSLLPVYGLRVGLDLSTSTNALTALIMGNVLLQFPIGWLADRMPKRLVLTGCAVVTAVTLAILPIAVGSLWMWPVLLVCGASGYAIYTTSLASLGDRFSGNELVTGTAAFATMWGCGALIGSVLGGWSMAGFGPHGLVYMLSGVCILLTLGIGLRAVQQRTASRK